MFREGNDDSIVQRSIDEALACQDMLERAPVKSSLMARMAAWFVETTPAITRRKPASKRRLTSIVPNIKAMR